MALYRRLIQIEDPPLPGHQFFAAISEVRRGKITGAEFLDMFNLSVSEKAELVTLRNQVTGGFLTPEEIHEVIMLAQQGLKYATEVEIKTRFGVI